MSPRLPALESGTEASPTVWEPGFPSSKLGAAALLDATETTGCMSAADPPEPMPESGTEASLAAREPEGWVVSPVINHDDVSGTDTSSSLTADAAGLLGEPTFLHFLR